MDKKLNLLWLPGWFPSKADMLSGDFIERHAKAVSEFAAVTVLFIVKDDTLTGTKKTILKEASGNLTIYRCYYSGKGICSVIRYYKLLFSSYKLVLQENGPFDLVHLHAPLRQSLLAIWIKKKYGIPYVITEHNSWYMEGDMRFIHQSVTLKWLICKTYAKTAAIHVVSNALGEQLGELVGNINSYTVIPNVVDVNLFTSLPKTDNASIDFIAITGDSYHKNTDGIIRAFARFLKEHSNAKLHIAGPNDEPLKALVKQLTINSAVVFYGAVSYEKIAALTRAADAMIFFTRYETFGCVMAESLCCGVPVVASKIPVLEENLTDTINALFVQPENEDDLVKKMNWFITNKNSFDSTSIATEASQKYSYHTVALQFMDFYNKALQTSK